AVVVDSTAMEIVAILEAATTNPIVRLDIKEGKAWWVTRLFALSVGAVRLGSPNVFVFIGVKQEAEGSFLGWAKPSALVRALVAENTRRGPKHVTYGMVYRRAERLTYQVATFLKPSGEPQPEYAATAATTTAATPATTTATTVDSGLPAVSEISRYVYRDNSDPHGGRSGYGARGEAALEQILLDQLGAYKLEDEPDQLTLGRLDTLFAHCLYRDTVDLDWTKDRQLAAFLESSAAYVAVVRRGRYEGLVERAEIER